MKKHLLFSLTLGLAFFLSLGSYNPSNPPTGNTGGPGETTCQKSGCHNGGSFNADLMLMGLPDTVIAGSSHSIMIHAMNNNSSRGGFQLMCLDDNDAKYGTLASSTGVGVTTASGRQYARQSTPKNVVGNDVSWTIDWTAPTTVGNANFYYTILLANGNGNESGDNVKTGTFSVPVVEAVSSSSDTKVVGFKAFPSTVTNTLTLAWQNETQPGLAQVFDLTGRKVFQKAVMSGAQLELSDLAKGNYIVHVTVNGIKATQQITKN